MAPAKNNQTLNSAMAVRSQIAKAPASQKRHWTRVEVNTPGETQKINLNAFVTRCHARVGIVDTHYACRKRLTLQHYEATAVCVHVRIPLCFNCLFYRCVWTHVPLTHSRRTLAVCVLKAPCPHEVPPRRYPSEGCVECPCYCQSRIIFSTV